MSSHFLNKSVTVKKAKERAWKAFSEYMRTLWTGVDGHAKCYTCDADVFMGKGIKPGKRAHTGHWVEGHSNATYINEDYVRAQCLTAESNLRMFSGKHKSIANIKKGDRLWAFNEQSFMREVATVLAIEEFTPEDLYEVEMEDGRKFYATGDHQIVANNKWVKIEDMLQDVTTYDILEL